MADLAQLLPGGLGGLGAGGLLAAIIIYLLTANRVDRKEYGEAIDREAARADKAEERRLAAVQRESDLHGQLDEARAARRLAEDRVAILERELARLQRTGGDL